MLRRILLASAGALALTGAAFAADLPSRVPPPAYLPPVFTWSGIYIGVSGGFAQGFHNFTDNDVAFAGATDQLKSNGFIGGGTLGINLQQGSLVYGLETDFSGITNSKDQRSRTFIDGDQFFSTNRMDFLGTVRGRLGIAVDRTLFYFTAGLAYGGVHNSFGRQDVFTGFGDPDPIIFSAGSTRIGWVAGGGLEYALTPNWTVKGEALYVDLGSTTATFTEPTGTGLVTPTPKGTTFHGHFDNTLVLVRAGVNYKLDWWGPGSVVARY